MKKPTTRREDVLEEVAGMRVADPYRWLENADDPAVVEWTREQTRCAKESLNGDEFSRYSAALERNFKVVNFSNPYPVNGRYFYKERQPDEDQFAEYVKEGLDGAPRKLIDPNGMRAGNTVAIAFTGISETGRYVAYGLSEGGTEMATLRVKDVATGEDLLDTIPNCRYSKVLWLPDDTGFFYTRNPRPGEAPKGEEHLHNKVYFHMLGDDPDIDELVFGEGKPKDVMIGLSLSRDGNLLAITEGYTWTENDVHLYDRRTKATRTLVRGMPSKFGPAFLDDRMLLVTNHMANNNRVLWAPHCELPDAIDQWRELIPEREWTLESVAVTKSKILCEYLVNVSSKVITYDYAGAETGEIPLPEHSSIAGISRNDKEEEFFYGVETFTFPKKAYRYDPESGAYSEFRSTDNPIDPDEYETEQEWFASKDGTNVPMFVVHKKGLERNGTHPAVLTAYGGFGNSMTPGFMRNWVPWLEDGGVLAVANIRGGGEFGEAWHKGGIKENKQNSFDDMIAAAEHLIAAGYTASERLGLSGGSNGGLLVAAVGVQRPDLVKAVCSRVPLTDMVRFPRFGIAVRWIHEYGNPEVREELERILTWSPYHNVRDGVEYPAFLFMTGEKDTRVDPLHARKMGALLQNANSENRVLVYTETDAGHGAGKPVSKMVESQAYALSFFAQELGPFPVRG